MVCLYCGHDTQVTNSRLQKRNNHIWRRRTCSACGGIFTTSEQPVLETTLLVTRTQTGGKATAFNRDKLFITIYESCRHRPNSVQDAAYVTDAVIGHILGSQTDGAIDRDDIVRITNKTLKRLDAVAAIMYAAYHPA